MKKGGAKCEEMEDGKVDCPGDVHFRDATKHMNSKGRNATLGCLGGGLSYYLKRELRTRY